MQTLEEIVKGHLENNEIGHLRNLEDQVHQLINFVKPKAMSILRPEASNLEISKKAASERNLEQAQRNFALIVSAIYKLENKHQ